MDAALVNNWEEMSETHYNMQLYTNVFMSCSLSEAGCCWDAGSHLGLWACCRGNGRREVFVFQAARELVQLSLCPTLKLACERELQPVPSRSNTHRSDGARRRNGRS